MGKGMVKWFMLFCLLTFLPLSLSAQVNNNEDEDDDEDEITVTDNKGREEVIEFPEAMTYDLDSLLNLYMSKTYLEEEDCNMRDINPVYSKEEYVSRLLRLPNVMEMVYNDVVQKFIDRRVGPESQGCLSRWCCWSLAVYDRNGQTIWIASQFIG